MEKELSIERLKAENELKTKWLSLVAPYAGPPVGDGDHPIGMILVELALDADHLRLDPEAEHHAEAVDLLAEAGEP